MKAAMRTLALIPARGGSKRLPGKNVRPFLGMPLIEWSIRFAWKMECFDRLIVSTDSEEIADVSRRAGAEIHKRCPELATDEAGSADVAIDVLQHEKRAGREYDLVALLQPTSPIRHPSRWHGAFGLIDDYDAVIGVVPVKHSLEGQSFSITGNLYLIRANVLQQEKTFRPQSTAIISCDQPCEAIDIDTESDWIAAEALTKHHAALSAFGAGTP